MNKNWKMAGLAILFAATGVNAAQALTDAEAEQQVQRTYDLFYNYVQGYECQAQFGENEHLMGYRKRIIDRVKPSLPKEVSDRIWEMAWKAKQDVTDDKMPEIGKICDDTWAFWSREINADQSKTPDNPF